MNKLEKLLAAVTVAGVISLAAGKITNEKYLTYIGAGSFLAPIVYVIISSGKPKGKNNVIDLDEARRNYRKN